MTPTTTHETFKKEIPYFRVEKIWEGYCECGYFSGKCISEAEVDFRLKQHREKSKE